VCIVGSLYGRDIVAPRTDEDINFITKPGGVSTIALVIKGDTGIVDGDISGNAGTVTNGVYTTGAQTIGGNKTFTGASVFENTKMKVITINNATVSLDGSANMVQTQLSTNLTVTPTLVEGQTVNWVVHNTHASSQITITFSPGGLTFFWRDGVEFNLVDAQEANVYTFMRIGNNVYVAAVTDMQ